MPSLFGPYTVQDAVSTPGQFGIDDAKGNTVKCFVNGGITEWEGGEVQAVSLAAQLSDDDSVYLTLLDTHYGVPYLGKERVVALLSAAISALSIVAAANPGVAGLQAVSATLNAAEIILDAV